MVYMLRTVIAVVQLVLSFYGFWLVWRVWVVRFSVRPIGPVC